MAEDDKLTSATTAQPRSRPLPLRFLAELNRRNFIRMGGLYLVGAWLVVQGAGTVLPMFGAPEWLARSVVILLVSGQREQAKDELHATKARLQALDNPYPGGWGGDNYLPSTLPGMLGDVDGVRAAERDYFDSAPRDALATLDVLPSLAVAFARAGAPGRALTHLETVARTFWPVDLPFAVDASGAGFAARESALGGAEGGL